MQSQLSNPAQRAQHRIRGNLSTDILIQTGANQDYTLTAYVTGYFQVIRLAAILASGTITIALKRIRAGVTTSVVGCTALAATSTRGTADATLDDTSLFIPGDRLIITTSANSAGVDIAVTVDVAPMGVGN